MAKYATSGNPDVSERTEILEAVSYEIGILMDNLEDAAEEMRAAGNDFPLLSKIRCVFACAAALPPVLLAAGIDRIVETEASDNRFTEASIRFFSRQLPAAENLFGTQTLLEATPSYMLRPEFMEAVTSIRGTGNLSTLCRRKAQLSQ